MEYRVNRDEELYHFGVKGMKWGVRRYQNRDGSLTTEGKERLKETVYGTREPAKERSNRIKAQNKVFDESNERYEREYKNYLKENPDYDSSREYAMEYWDENIRDKKTADAEFARYVDDWIKETSKATLKDLKMKETEEAKEYLENLWIKRHKELNIYRRRN